MKTRNKITIASLIMALGIAYGDIGTSPLYVMKAVIAANNYNVDRTYILGALSLIIWTLTMQTTIKYVWLVLKADNHNEGGVLSLYTLVREHYKKLLYPAVIGSAALLAESIITPAVSVTSAVEGINNLVPIDRPAIIAIVATIITTLFFLQHYGSEALGKTFGVIMLIWFILLGSLGLSYVLKDPSVLRAINPMYGINLLKSSSVAFIILGAVFLCTTGAEALYSDLGHCGRANIRYTWIFVKITLILNYLGQGVVLLEHQGTTFTQSPFFSLMPQWFLLPGVIIATIAASIASQSLISGAFTLISEAIKLELFPRLVINYPSSLKGQVYIPAVNFWMWVGCLGIVFIFKESANMGAAYGLSITVAMLMTTILYFYYLKSHTNKKILPYIFLLVYLTIEGTFLISNIFKIPDGGYVTLIVGSILMGIMYIWIKGRVITSGAAERVRIDDYVKNLMLLQKDKEIPYMCTNLVYLTQSRKDRMVEKKIIYSILNRGSKKAKVYWFVNVDVSNEPYTMEYRVDTIKPKRVFKVHFNLGFRINRNLTNYMKYVIQDMMDNGELNKVNLPYRIESDQNDQIGDVKFIMLNETMNNTDKLTRREYLILKIKLLIKKYTISPIRWFGIDSSNVQIESLPLLLPKKKCLPLKRVQ